MPIFIKIIFGVVILATVLAVFMYAEAPSNPFTPNNSQTAKQKLWGAYAGDTPELFKQFEGLVGREADMQAVFVNWGDSFPSGFAVKGKIFVIFWEQYGITLDEIISGKTDNYIRQFAKEVKDFNSPVILAPLHEMNGEWVQWSGVAGGNTPVKTVLAFQYIQDVFMAGNLQNVEWAWVVNHESVPDTKENSIENYYPGNKYVDYVGVDGFNFGDPWQTYDEIFSVALEKLKTYKKPIYIFSMASAEGSRKAEWIKDAFGKIKADPDIGGFIWFNENKEKNWLINSDPLSLQAFQQGISDF